MDGRSKPSTEQPVDTAASVAVMETRADAPAAEMLLSPRANSWYDDRKRPESLVLWPTSELSVSHGTQSALGIAI